MDKQNVEEEKTQDNAVEAEEPPSKHYTNKEWNDWKWQLKNAITTIEEVKKHVVVCREEEDSHQSLSLKITPYYLDIIAKNPNSPIRKTMIPTRYESVVSDLETEDPLNEDHSSPVPGIVHRYPDRVLFLVSDVCSAHCRYCTRSRAVGQRHDLEARERWDKCIEYIKEHKEVRDVLISGGDPLLLSNASLEYILSELKKIDHVEMLRIGTKVPVVLPQRIDDELCQILKKYHPLFMSIHFTHPDEITEECKKACNMLADAGIPLGSQTVLLKDINDSVAVMKKLYHELLKIRIKPYYIYSLDPIQGSGHFKVKIKKGLEIMEGLRGHTSGYAMPSYVIDAPGGGGKIPLLPNYVVGRNDKGVILRNYENKQFFYPD
jgi:lysine 2,3-aminomutase